MFTRVGTTIYLPDHSPLRQQLSIESVKYSNEPHLVTLPAYVEAEPRNTINILPPLTGRIIALPAQLGDCVKKDQILAILASPNLALASADYERAQNNLNLTIQALKRAESVYATGGNSLKDVQSSMTDFHNAQTEMKRAQAVLKAFGRNQFSQFNIKAPMDGCIIALNYGMGAFVNDPTMALMTLANLNTVWVTAMVPENLIALIKPTQPVAIELPAYPSQLLQGQISFVSRVLDPDTHRNKTRINLSNTTHRLQPNMFASVHLSLPEEEQLMIPISAVLMNNDSTSVYVEKSRGVFEPREVTLGLEDHDKVRVLSGLSANERIITQGGIFIND
jgi:cobalt-zinc-cadmium efflux system membrane fusion protein